MFASAAITPVDAGVGIPRARRTSATRAAHDVNLAIIGASGRVGRRVLQLIARSATASSVSTTRLQVVAAINSRRALIVPGGLDAARAAETLCATGPTDVAIALEALVSLPRPLVVVDCTASAAVVAHYPTWLAEGIDIVTPNKLGPSADHPLALQIAAAEAIKGAQLYDATTVGAQLPLLSTLRDLRDAGDRVERFEAVLSGTLSYVLGRVQRGEALSVAVRAAVAEGYAEPHPAADLSGADAARKLVILLRALGHDIELADVECVPLVDAGLLAEPDPVRLLQSLVAADETWRARAAVAEARRERWIYRASFEHDPASSRPRARIAPERVTVDHPLANLAPCENKLVLHSAFYGAAPLAVSGPGAGIDLTAAGVFGDLQLAVRRHALGHRVTAGSC